MELGSRKLIDKSFTVLGGFSILLIAAALVVLLAPIIWNGVRAVVFRATVEHREMQLEQFGHGDEAGLESELGRVRGAREEVYGLLGRMDAALEALPFIERRELESEVALLKEDLRGLLGPLPGEPEPALPRDRYGATRWDRALVHRQHVLFVEEYDYSDPTKMGTKVLVPRAEVFADTPLQPLVARLTDTVERDLGEMLHPRWTFYWRFFTEESVDAHFFGGIWSELLGTFYLTLGTILFAVPLGVVSAIYLVEYASPQSRVIGLIRTCVSTLAGVPSIVFGLFGLAFFINTLHVSESKSVLAGSLTLAVLVLPIVIRASEEALRAVPQTYKEAAVSLGASRWRAILSVILPAALPGILTGVVISMGRAAGETAPIIFTAAVSLGDTLMPWETVSQPTPALPWNVYNLAAEHEAVDEIRHVQYGMVFTLVMLVLLMSSAAILMRARLSRKMRA